MTNIKATKIVYAVMRSSLGRPELSVIEVTETAKQYRVVGTVEGPRVYERVLDRADRRIADSRDEAWAYFIDGKREDVEQARNDLSSAERRLAEAIEASGGAK